MATFRRASLPDEWPVWLIDPSNPDAGLQKPADLTVENGPAISLGAVVGSLDADTLVAELPDSIVLLRRAH
ncbi:MAG: hypothetical protein LAN70_15070 [Acidobacteriia bacterium]|nr:hypothetical protein [Terriglobia bacterium]